MACALAEPAGVSDAPHEVQLAGADVLTYRKMMQRHAAISGRRAGVGDAVREALA